MDVSSIRYGRIWRVVAALCCAVLSVVWTESGAYAADSSDPLHQTEMCEPVPVGSTTATWCVTGRRNLLYRFTTIEHELRVNGAVSCSMTLAVRLYRGGLFAEEPTGGKRPYCDGFQGEAFEFGLPGDRHCASLYLEYEFPGQEKGSVERELCPFDPDRQAGLYDNAWDLNVAPQRDSDVVRIPIRVTVSSGSQLRHILGGALGLGETCTIWAHVSASYDKGLNEPVTRHGADIRLEPEPACPTRFALEGVAQIHDHGAGPASATWSSASAETHSANTAAHTGMSVPVFVPRTDLHGAGSAIEYAFEARVLDGDELLRQVCVIASAVQGVTSMTTAFTDCP